MTANPVRQPTQNPRINPATGLPWTTEAEKQAIKDLLDRRTGKPGEGDSSESSFEGETPRKQRKTSRDLVAKKRVVGELKRSQERGIHRHPWEKGKRFQ